MNKIRRRQSHPGRLSAIAHHIRRKFWRIFYRTGTKILIQRDDDAFQDREVRLEFHNWIGDPPVVTQAGGGSKTATPCTHGIFDHAVLSVGVAKGDELNQIEGSAFMIGPGVAFTASHVIDNVEYDDLILTSVSQCDGLFWKCESVSMLNDDHDIAVLSLKLASKVPTTACVHKFGVSETLPKKGDTLKMFGYRQTDLRSKSGSQAVTEVSLDFLYCEGVITDVYPDYKTPRVAVDCGAIGGMSGGIAMNSDGLACGVISSSLEMEDGSISPTFVALTSSVFDLQFKMRRILGQVECTTLAHEAARNDPNPAICFEPKAS